MRNLYECLLDLEDEQRGLQRVTQEYNASAVPSLDD